MWHYLEPSPDEDIVVGPIELSKIVELVRTGALPEEVLISRDRERWEYAYSVPEFLDALPLDRDRIVREYLEYAAAPLGEENWGWASDRMFNILDGAPDIAWDIVTRLIDEAPSDDTLGYFAAGPLEDLLSDHGAHVIESVEQRARSNPKFVRALRLLRRLRITDEIWERVQRAAGRIDA